MSTLYSHVNDNKPKIYEEPTKTKNMHRLKIT